MIIESPLFVNTPPLPLTNPLYSAFFGVVRGVGLPIGEPSNTKEPVYAYSNSNITTGLGIAGTLTVDGAALGSNTTKRVLLANQTSAVNNGIYLYTHSGAAYDLVRAADFDDAGEVLAGLVVLVQEGTVYRGYRAEIVPGSELGVDNLNVTPYSAVFTAYENANPADANFLRQVIYGVCIRATTAPNIFDVDYIIDGEIVTQGAAPHSLTYTRAESFLYTTVEIFPPVGYSAPVDPAIEWCAFRDTELTFLFRFWDSSANVYADQTYTRTIAAIDTDQITYVTWVDDSLPQYSTVYNVYPRWWGNAVNMTEGSVPVVATSVKDKDAIKAIAAIKTVAPDMDFYQEKALERFFVTLKNSGVWAILDSLQVYANSMPQVVSPADATDQAIAMSTVDLRQGVVRATASDVGFSPGLGFYAPTTDAYLDTGFIPSLGAKYAKTSGTVGVLVAGRNAGVGGALCGARNSATQLATIEMYPDGGDDTLDEITWGVHATAVTNPSVPRQSVGGLLLASRYDNTHMRVYRTGAVTVAVTAASANEPTLSVYVCNENNGGTPTKGESNRPVMAFVAGSEFSQAKYDALTRALNTYIMALNSPHT